MRILVTGSAGHLGEALVRTLLNTSHDVVGLDLLQSKFTNQTGSIVDRDFVKRCMEGVDAVLHAATLHKPHVGTHSRQSFIDTNITGTLNLLEEAALAGVRAFIFTSTTSAFGRALTPAPGAPAAWITDRARNELGWRPVYDFQRVLDRLRAGQDPRSPLARAVGSKGYHAAAFTDGPYPTETQ